MCNAKNSIRMIIHRLVPILFLILGLVSVGCGRSHLKNSSSESGEEEREDIDSDTSLDAGPDTIEPVSTITTDPRTVSDADGSPQRPTTNPADASTKSDASSDSSSSGALDSSQPCEEESDCPLDYRWCEVPLCTSEGICAYEPLEDGTPCNQAAGSRICVDGLCIVGYCGDGFVDTNMGEICDDGNSINTDDCVYCEEATCGDGYIHSGYEECEPSNNSPNNSHCGADCTLSECGDGVVTSPVENCEPSIDGDTCNDNCRLSDTPQWKHELYTSTDIGLSAHGSFLLLDSTGQPTVVTLESYTDDNNILKDKTVIAKFDLDGEQLWQWASDEQDLPLDPSLDSNEPIRSVYPFGAAIDANDQVVISGAIIVEELSTKTIPWLLKIDEDGQFLWSTTIDQDQYGLHSVAVDDQSNIMALMSSQDSVSSSFATVADPSIELFDPDGTHRVDDSVDITGIFDYRDALHSGMVGDASAFILAGARETSSGVATFMVLLDKDGQMIWDSPIVHADPEQDIGFRQAIAAVDGDIVALGKSDFYRGVFTDPDQPNQWWFERYAPDGTARYEEKVEILFTQTDDNLTAYSPFPTPTTFFPMGVDRSNNVLFAYSVATAQMDTTLIVDKYDSEGESVWERPLYYETENGDVHIPLEIAVNTQGSIFILDWLSSLDDGSNSIGLYRWDEWNESE